jgi:hypothetical protein
VKLSVVWNVSPCTLVDTDRSFHHHPEGSHLHTRRRENLKSQVFKKLRCSSDTELKGGSAWKRKQEDYEEDDNDYEEDETPALNQPCTLLTWRTGLLPVAVARVSLPPWVPTHSIVLRFKYSQLARRPMTSQLAALPRTRRDSNTQSYNKDCFQARSARYHIARCCRCSFVADNSVGCY